MRLLKNEVDPRLVVTLDRTMKKVDKGVNGLMTYGARNDYPQLMERLINGSPTGKSTANIYAKFLSGAGFENEEINKIVIGKDPRGKNVTLKGMLRAVCQSISKNNGFYIHCNFNNDIKIVNTHLKDFKTIRFSKPDDTGYTAKLLASLFWAESVYSKPKDVIEYNVFNTNETAFVSMINEAGAIEKFKGQIYFSFLDTEYFYPLSNYDEVYLDLDTENQIQLFKNRQLRNGFFKKTILRLQPQDNEEKNESLAESARQSLGADGDGLWIIEDNVQADGTLNESSAYKFDQLESNIEDKLFESWESSLSNSIRKAAKGMPAILIDYENSKLGNTSGEAIMQANKFYNAITADDRAFISESFKEIYSIFDNSILNQNTNWNIKPLNLL